MNGTPEGCKFCPRASASRPPGRVAAGRSAPVRQVPGRKARPGGLPWGMFDNRMMRGIGFCLIIPNARPPWSSRPRFRPAEVSGAAPKDNSGAPRRGGLPVGLGPSNWLQTHWNNPCILFCAPATGRTHAPAGPGPDEQSGGDPPQGNGPCLGGPVIVRSVNEPSGAVGAVRTWVHADRPQHDGAAPDPLPWRGPGLRGCRRVSAV